MTRSAEIEEVAARWLLRREEEEWSPVDHDDLEAWLNADPEHRMAFWRLEFGWGEADRLGALGAPVPQPRRRAWVPRSWRPVAVAASLAIGVALGVAALDGHGRLGPKSYETVVGGRQTVPLADGSKVEMNTATRLRAAVSRTGREVWLDRGEAYFEVAHDPNRPFVVHAGPQAITVLGTRFSVRRDGERVEVVVLEGRVRVTAVVAARAGASILTGGDIIVADGVSTLRPAKSATRVADELSWRQGLLTFDQVTLAEAAAEFNRYNRKQMVIADPAIASIRIGGSFEAENVEAFARLLQRGFGLKVDDDGERVTVSG